MEKHFSTALVEQESDQQKLKRKWSPFLVKKSKISMKSSKSIAIS